MTDIQIAEGLIKGDINCYEKLIDEYTKYVIAVIRKIAGTQLSNEDVEELTSDVFVKMWQVRGSIIPDKLKAYIAKITRNAVLNKLRQTSIELIDDTDDVIIDTNTPETELMTKEVNSQIISAIDTLPQPDKEIFLRRYFFMEKIADIATYLGLPENTVHTKISRGKKKLQQVLEGCRL
ncbi:MAG: hypothetical protein ATN35_00960 [Epulopiscium sp. Nele67-Bin004]|nr:MAG: hypothetical protein ATN35_00960 [Epulopiscium sp. Nele67-Bin004]